MKPTKMIELKTNASGLFSGKLSMVLALAVAGLLLAAPARAERPGVGGKRDVDVMTVNLYVGGDISRVMAINPADTNYVEELVEAVTGVYYEILASAPQVRLQAVANKIARQMPDIVAVEEASLIRLQSPGDLMIGGTAAATDVVFDYLQILVADLQARGAHYQIVSTAGEADVELPMFNMQTGQIDDVRLTDREAILVRADLPPGHLRLSNPQSGSFVNVIPIPALGMAVERGWCSVDVSIRGRNFRCICTHLETEVAPLLQAAQVQELLAGPAKTRLPVIILGDFNADPLHRDGSMAYDLMPAAGFSDAWAMMNAGNPAGGLTWGHDEFLADPGMAFDRRIDFVFYRGKGIVPEQADVIDLITGLPQPPLWASDHAALSARFLLK
jgi:endonuclease/exonuclease/phosphatase family metal-dependent hydrolase